jgi:predicted DNA-binding helix-hairpin-helix protein
VLKRAQYFITCGGKGCAGLRVTEDGILRHLIAEEAPRLVAYQPEQLSLFS